MDNHIDFVPLYFKSEYSLLHSTCKIEPSIRLVKEYGYQALAITDIDTMYGTLKFYNTCIKNSLKPIIGLKIKYIYNNRENSLLLYAMSMFGYKNLMRISSQTKISGKPLSMEFLESNSIGVLAIVPSMENDVFSYLSAGDQSKAFEHYSMLKMIYRELYLGISLNTVEERKSLSSFYNFGKEHQIKMTACMPVSYLSLSDLDAYQTLLSIDNGGSLVTLNEFESNQYLKTIDEVRLLYQGYEDLLETTNYIASKCNVEIEFQGYQLPKYINEQNEEIDAKAYLRELCIKGLRKRIALENVVDVKTYQERLIYELDTIDKMGFNDYFLIVWDYVKFAKKQGIYVGPGRGSAAASLVSYSLGITNVDPIKHSLLFERFLNSERITMPDIDIDFPDDERDKVIEYVGKKYGNNHVAHIGTFGTFKVKLAIRDTARVHKTKESSLNQVIKIIDRLDRKSLLTGSVTLEMLINTNEEMIRLMSDFEEIDKLLTIASKLEGLPRNVSTHAAGIIVTNYDLVNYTALDNGLDNIYQTQFESSDLESLGLLKMDFLGLRNLTTINQCVKKIQQDYPNFALPKEYNDKETFAMLARGDVDGVFQLESEGMRKLLMELKVEKFDDINHALALYRPGPMDIIPVFIKRKFGQEKVVYYHPDLEDILKETYGTIVYQEQIMLIAHKFAKYSLGEADVLRRAVTKKKADVLERERVKFVESSIKAGYDEKVASEIYDYIVKFANYGFNKAHSVAYAQISYITAYLKCHYFIYYLTTLMSGVLNSETDIKRYYSAALKKNIKVLGPNINYSQEDFIVKDGSIIFPLNSIKGLGLVKTKSLLEERSKGLYQDYEDFVVRTKDFLPYSLLENVIYSGALDSFGLTKKAMIDSYQNIINRSEYDFVKSINRVYSDEEFTYGELLTKEKEIIGLNIKYNFFFQYQVLYEKYHLQKIATIKENMIVKTLGLIKTIKIIKTKHHEDMAFIKLEDENAQIELTVFPKVYCNIENLIIGQIVIVTGKTQMRKDLQIIVDKIEKV